MRWIFKCVLLASIAMISATEDDPSRPRRDISLLKDILWTKIFGAAQDGIQIPVTPEVQVKVDDNVRIFRIPGFDNILVKAVPKVKQEVNVEIPSTSDVNVEENDNINSSIAIINSYLGTHTLNETLFALNGVKNLLDSGVLSARRDGVVTIQNFGVPSLVPQVLLNSEKINVETDKTGRPVYLLPSLQGGVSTTSHHYTYPIVKEIRPISIELPDLPLPTKYSYKQVHGSGVTSYAATDNKNVVVMESKKPVPLPPYIGHRFQEILGLCFIPNAPTALPAPILPAGIDMPFIYDHPKHPELIEVKPAHTSHGYSYQQVHKGGTVTEFTGTGHVKEMSNEKPVLVVEDAPLPLPLPNYLSNRIEYTTASKVKPAVVKETFYGPPIPVIQEPYPVIVERMPEYVHAPPTPVFKEEVYVNQHSQRDHQSHNTIPNEYSYQSVHNDGSVTFYSDLGNKIGGASHGVRGDRVAANHGSTFGGHLHVNSVVQQPIPLPGFLSNRIEHTATSAHAVKPAVVKETFYGPPLPVYPEPYPVIVEPLPQHVHVPIKPILQEVHITANTPGWTHQSGGIGMGGTVENGKYQISPGFHEGNKRVPVLENNHVHKIKCDHQTSGKTDPCDSKPSGFSYTSIHDDGSVTLYSNSGTQQDKASTITSTAQVLEKSGASGTNNKLLSGPVLSQYMYKQINHNGPDPFLNVNINDVSGLDGQVNVLVGKDMRKVTPYPNKSRTSHSKLVPKSTKMAKVPSDYVFVPPTLPTKPANSGYRSSHTYTHVNNKGGYKNIHGSTGSSASSSATKVLETVTVSSENSLSANPIVVLPDEKTFSYTQNKVDGSSVTILGTKDSVSVVGESSTEHSRGDIPEMVFK